MTTTDTQPSEFTPITPAERAYIRSELDQFFSTFPTIADGIQLRTWRTGARKNQPKRPPAAQSLLTRNLVRLDTAGRLPRLVFTAAGHAALRWMFADKRLADPHADFLVAKPWLPDGGERALSGRDNGAGVGRGDRQRQPVLARM